MKINPQHPKCLNRQIHFLSQVQQKWKRGPDFAFPSPCTLRTRTQPAPFPGYVLPLTWVLHTLVLCFTLTASRAEHVLLLFGKSASFEINPSPDRFYFYAVTQGTPGLLGWSKSRPQIAQCPLCLSHLALRSCSSRAQAKAAQSLPLSLWGLPILEAPAQSPHPRAAGEVSPLLQHWEQDRLERSQKENWSLRTRSQLGIRAWLLLLFCWSPHHPPWAKEEDSQVYQFFSLSAKILWCF